MSGARGVIAKRNRSFHLATAGGFLSLVLLLVLLACASGGGDDPFVGGTRVEKFLLRVESRNTQEVSVYIIPAGRRTLLGTVPGNGVRMFEFDYPPGRPLFVELETRLGDRHRMPGRPFLGGGRLSLVVQGDLRRSSYVAGVARLPGIFETWINPRTAGGFLADLTIP